MTSSGGMQNVKSRSPSSDDDHTQDAAQSRGHTHRWTVLARTWPTLVDIRVAQLACPRLRAYMPSPPATPLWRNTNFRAMVRSDGTADDALRLPRP